jgi:hypothetical protein
MLNLDSFWLLKAPGKKIVGYYAGLECRSKHRLEKLEDGLIRQFPEGVRDQGSQSCRNERTKRIRLRFRQFWRKWKAKKLITVEGGRVALSEPIKKESRYS